jgi:CBS domain-containing protein
VSKKINKTVSLLVREGAKAGNITRIITEINDRLLKKVLEVTEARMGPPPRSYCWIVFGSEGRKEQTFKTDQDNAIIFDDADSGGEEAAAYFHEFAVRIKDGLLRCGFPTCKADYMASNPEWCQPLGVWKRYFSNWIDRPTAEAILRSLIFFDFRPVHGNVLLAERLRAFLGHEIRDKELFLAHMAGNVVKNRPPLDFFGKFRCEKKGANCGKLDLKINGLSPIIDAARLSALEMKVYNTSTLERLMELRDRGGTVSKFSRELEQAFEFLLSLRLRHQFEQIQQGTEPDNHIDPFSLGTMERTQLKESFKLILTVQEAARQKYGSLMVI